jgi:hypothetical protein
VVHRVANVQSVTGVLRIALADMELRCLLEPCVLGMGVYSLSLENVLDYFAFYESFCLPVVLERANYFVVGGNGVLLEVGVLRSLVVLNPGRAVLLVASVVQGALGSPGKGVVSRLVHVGFIFNLNNIPEGPSSTKPLQIGRVAGGKRKVRVTVARLALLYFLE